MKSKMTEFKLPFDVTKPITPVDDKYLQWPGKKEGKPKPKIIWIK